MPRKPADPSPAATITTAAGTVTISNPVQDTDHSVSWVVQGARSALVTLLPGLIRVKGTRIRGLVQLVVVAQRCL